MVTKKGDENDFTFFKTSYHRLFIGIVRFVVYEIIACQQKKQRHFFFVFVSTFALHQKRAQNSFR